MKTFYAWFSLAALTAGCIVLIGVWARLMKELFCLGYGC